MCKIRQFVDEALFSLDAEFAALCADLGRPPLRTFTTPYKRKTNGVWPPLTEPFGRATTIGPMVQAMLRGIKRVGAQFTLTMAACNLARLPQLLAA